ncbi:hypothetical protein FHW69_002992 [Luteibacter sp. Sphag1AF]|uniref:hypothetical protein n=1 Tax=Luteibacter sp. Sphag1AF TaxID=2587031 RepID=UPI001614590E|nr:hypothetical protein [Luteibacter sp. Sphag1AF]MBB3228357.1 hypothetical protein [Luteibacter sp. Sphag1AF]
MTDDDIRHYLEGRLMVEVEPHEVRMSHWVYAPRVTDVHRGVLLIDLIGSPWDLMHVEESDGGIELTMRKYPGDCDDLKLRITVEPPGLYVNGRVVEAGALSSLLESL